MLINNPSAPSLTDECCYMCCDIITIVEQEINIYMSTKKNILDNKNKTNLSAIASP